MRPHRIVLDTNVLIAALRSKRGASHLLVSMLEDPRFVTCLSVPLVLEYEDVAKRQAAELGLTEQDVDDVLDHVCAVSEHREIYYLWRPFLRDPRDDMVLEVAVEAECGYILTYNGRDFAGVDQFGIEAITPKQFLQQIGEIQ
jgi:putative PIN family toxin of toxin-antitoxin system